MPARRATGSLALWLVLTFVCTAVEAQTATQTKTFEPEVGQPGKDVVWVPTPQEVVDRMLSIAKTTAQDFVIDLGSGDGRTVITAAKLGAGALGIEYNPDMVELSKHNAAAAGVGDKVTFMKADLFETDFSKATVLTMFLLPSINMKLRPTILDLKPGTRIVSNTFSMEDWEPDERDTVADCSTNWCTVLFWVVPAKVDGVWQLGGNTLTLKQTFQMVSGTLGSMPISGKLHGAEISFKAGNTTYTGQVAGNSIKGTQTGGSTGSWTATKR